MDDDVRFITPVEILSFYFNGYYVFNGRRYSQAAAYNQSVIQRRSAGSLLLGATIFASSLDMAEKENALLLEMGSCPGSMSLGEINVGLGYGYNWVPARGWVVNAMVMPTISIYDRIKRTNFTSNYTIYPKTGVSGDYGSWDSDKRQWANGETQRPITDGETTVENWLDDAEMWETNTESHTSAFKLNVDARVGVAYCWGRYFVSTNGQLLHFRYNSKGNSMTHGEWYVNTSFGIRL